MVAILAAHKPSPQHIYPVVFSIQALSQTTLLTITDTQIFYAMERLKIAGPAKGETASDPAASAEDSGEAAVQKKLLWSFLTHVLELYIKANMVEWSYRLLEHYRPEKVISHGL